ncbi:hypothetical protein HAX54_019439 [Datura stramonium]|uniref:Uncharacterized protein n=1 Tax=Datura stramonium TaxID=4076 RepID=A0ABS8UP63_DATST|nr:hypothetical protein [Datura stramonium]
MASTSLSAVEIDKEISSILHEMQSLPPHLNEHANEDVQVIREIKRMCELTAKSMQKLFQGNYEEYEKFNQMHAAQIISGYFEIYWQLVREIQSESSLPFLMEEIDRCLITSRIYDLKFRTTNICLMDALWKGETRVFVNDDGGFSIEHLTGYDGDILANALELHLMVTSYWSVVVKRLARVYNYAFIIENDKRG